MSLNENLLMGYSQIYCPSVSTKQLNNGAKSFILFLSQKGFYIENPAQLNFIPKNNLESLSLEFLDIFEELSFNGVILRSSFHDSEQLQPYSEDDYILIYAHYSIRYDWENEFKLIFSVEAQEFIDSQEKDSLVPVQLNETRLIGLTLINDDELIKKLSSLMATTRALNDQEERVLFNSPIELFSKSFSITEIKFKEVLAYSIHRLWKKVDQSVLLDSLETINDFMRFLTLELSVLVTDQVSQDKWIYFKIPTSERKKILAFLEEICAKNPYLVAKNM